LITPVTFRYIFTPGVEAFKAAGMDADLLRAEQQGSSLLSSSSAQQQVSILPLWKYIVYWNYFGNWIVVAAEMPRKCRRNAAEVLRKCGAYVPRLCAAYIRTRMHTYITACMQTHTHTHTHLNPNPSLQTAVSKSKP